MTPIEDTDIYCYPVEQAGDVYIISSDWLRSDLPAISIKSLPEILGNAFQSSRGKVIYGGEPHEAYIYAGDENECYAVLSFSSDPAHELISEKNSKAYFRSLREQCAFSEFVLPEQRATIEHDFVAPNLINWSSDGPKRCEWRKLRTTNRTIIIGSAGAGKTTLLRMLMLEEAKRDVPGNERIFPVYVPLRKMRRGSSIEECALKEFRNLGGIDLAVDFKTLAESGKIILILDGFDEIHPDIRDLAGDSLKSFIEKYESTGIILSTRWGVEPDETANFNKIEIAPFGTEQMREIAYHKLYDTGQSRQFSSKLFSEKQLRKVAGNPLILTLLIARYIRNEFTPFYVSEALSAICEVLLDEWDAVRGIVRSNTSYSLKRKTSVLSALAAHLTEVKKDEFTVQEVTVKLEKVISGVPTIEILKHLQASTSMISTMNEETWRFRNSYMQEFLSSVHWLDRLTSEVGELISEVVLRPSEMLIRRFRLLIGLASDASNPVNRFLEQSKDGSLDTAHAISEAMTQRIVINPSVSKDYSEYIAAILERFFSSGALDFEVNTSESDPNTSIWSLKIFGSQKQNGKSDVNKFVILLETLHRTREGSASTFLKSRLNNSRLETIKHLAKLLDCEGDFSLNYISHSTVEISVIEQKY